MNELLQRHGCANVFNVPEGLRELMADISREVLRWQPPKIYDFIANYLSALLITREHGVMATRILEDMCDCHPTLSEHLLEVGFTQDDANTLAQIIQEEIENSYDADEGKAKFREYIILERIMEHVPLDEELSVKVCQVARNAYRDHWYHKKVTMISRFDEPWEQAAKNTLELYKKTKPSISEMNRAAERIQAAYKGYHLRRNVLRSAKKKAGRKIELPGPPLDIDNSRKIDLGYVLKIKPPQDDMGAIFKEDATAKLAIKHDPMKALTLQYNTSVLVKPVYNKSEMSHRKKITSSLMPGEVTFKDDKNDWTKQDGEVTSGQTRISFLQNPIEIPSENEIVEEPETFELASDQGGEEVPEMIISTAEYYDTNEMEDEAAVVSSRSVTADEMSDVPDET